MTGQRRGLSRRRFLGAAGAAGAAAALGADAVVASEALAAAPHGSDASAVVPFHGAHQAGIVTPVQDRLVFAAFDVDTDERAELMDLLWDWTRAAERMTDGRPAPGRNHPAAPPEDTGEARDLDPARLTLTFGFGRSLFERDGATRFELGGRRPAALVDLPAFAGDALDLARSGGDLAVQACADDAQVAFHAVRNLARIARGRASVRWLQLGFGRTSTTTRGAATPRNLMGFKDGTNNITAGDADALAEHVWVGRGDDPAWMRGGSYLVARRIRMRLEEWDNTALEEQEATIGRYKVTGAPLGSLHEHDALDLEGAARGRPVIPLDAHVRLTAPETHGGVRMLRRGYSFTDGIDGTGRIDAGLFFVSYQRDPRTSFVPIQQRLASGDALNEYVQHTASAVFACPAGVERGGAVGASLFE